MVQLKPTTAVLAFLSFALTYFLSNVVRAITATISPQLQSEFALTAGDLGLLAGGYFFGFATMQIPMGTWLDRLGVKKVLLRLLGVALLGFAGFTLATSLQQLLLARVLIGVGLSACLMAPLTAYRQWFSSALQLRCNSWMLMTGALGMLVSTLPIHWVLPYLGWRGVFVTMAILCAFSMLAIVFLVPATSPSATVPQKHSGGYITILKNPYFQSLAPMAFFVYGSYMAMQTLWVGPWLTNIAGNSPAQTALGLFNLNATMLATFFVWGWVIPRLNAKGIHANGLIIVCTPLCFITMLLIASFPAQAQWWWWALYLVFASALSFAQPTLAMQFDDSLAGRALTSFNVLLFAGGFGMQWCFGLAIDALVVWGFAPVIAYQGALYGLTLLNALAFFWFVYGVRMRSQVSAVKSPT